MGILIILFLLLLPIVVATPPPRLHNGNELVVPYTTNGLEKTETVPFLLSDNTTLYSSEQDPDLEFIIKKSGQFIYHIKFLKNPSRIRAKTSYDMEVCYIGKYAPKMTKKEKRTIGKPINCVGEYSYHTTIKENKNYKIQFNNNNILHQMFDFYIGNGGRGGSGGIGCVPGWSVIGLTTSTYPSGTINTETQFQHITTVSLTVGAPGGSCTITFKDKPYNTYRAYTSSYYTGGVLHSGAKISAGSTTNPLQITTGGTYKKYIKCGIMHGTLYLGVTAGSYNSYNTVSCTDVVHPTITQISPTNNTNTNASTYDFSCSATDNTGIRYIDLYANFSGTYQLVSSQSYGYLTYSATKTFSGISINNSCGTPHPYNWACKARDTRSPTNDEWAGNRTITYNLDCPAGNEVLVIIDGVFPSFISPLGCLNSNNIVVFQSDNIWQRVFGGKFWN